MRDSKKVSQPKPKIEKDETKDEMISEEINDDAEVEEYYLGKDRDDERKKKAYV